MKFIISNYHNDLGWLPKYTSDYVIYNQGGELEGEKVIQTPHAGSDICDKFRFIIDNYDDLPEVAAYVKGNLFKYITMNEFDKLLEKETFAPLLTQRHKTYLPICWYEDGLYCELNNYWYLSVHPARYAKEIIEFFGMDHRTYNKFAPGSNYILTKENILKHPKETYIKLKSYLEWDVYPGDAQLMERNLYKLWK